MRTRRLTLVITGIVTALAAGTVVAALPAAAAELLSNPGFESGTLSGWSCEAADTVASGQSHGGTFALVGTPTNSVTAQCQQTVSVVPATAYTLSGFVNGTALAWLTTLGLSDASSPIRPKTLYGWYLERQRAAEVVLRPGRKAKRK